MKKFILYLFAISIVSQLIRPNKNTSVAFSEGNITLEEKVPDKIQKILERSCYDCHSNNTDYQWYHKIAPVSWIIALHVNQGKEHVNFDQWKSYNADQKEHIVKDLVETIETREMPLVAYLKIHPDAVISDEDNKELLDWVNTLKLEYLKNK